MRISTQTLWFLWNTQHKTEPILKILSVLWIWMSSLKAKKNAFQQIFHHKAPPLRGARRKYQVREIKAPPPGNRRCLLSWLPAQVCVYVCVPPPMGAGQLLFHAGVKDITQLNQPANSDAADVKEKTNKKKKTRAYTRLKTCWRTLQFTPN